MFATMTNKQRALFRRDAATALVQLFVLGPALLLLIAWTIWWATALMGLPGNDLARGFLGDSFMLLLYVQIYVMAAMAIPAAASALSDPVVTRLEMWTLTACLISLLPQVFWLIEAFGRLSTSWAVVTAPSGLRFAIRPQPSVPALCFSPGCSPQLE